MRISKYGICLVRLTEDDLELVRYWRNNDEIKKYMNFQEYITPEMQQKWFLSINTSENFYYIIEYKGDKIGLVNDKNIDWREKTAEGGMFIWDKKYLNSIVPLKVSMLMLEIAYILLGWNKTYIKVRKDNTRAVEYNRKLGYEVVHDNESEPFHRMALDRKQFFEKSEKLRRLISSDSQNEKVILIFEKTDELNGTRSAVEKIFKLAQPESAEDKIEIIYS